MTPPAGKPSSTRLSGLLTAATGLLLAAVTVFQATYLHELSGRVRDEVARAELRGLGAGLRWRLERDLALNDHNTPAMQRALEELVADSAALDWAALYAPGGRRLAAAGPAVEPPAGELSSAVSARPEDLPEVFAGTRRGFTRVRAARREMILAAGFSRDADWATGRLGALITGVLVAGLTAALLLLVRGAAEIAGLRRAGAGQGTSAQGRTFT